MKDSIITKGKCNTEDVVMIGIIERILDLGPDKEEMMINYDPKRSNRK